MLKHIHGFIRLYLEKFDQACKNGPSEHNNCRFLSSSLCRNVIPIYTTTIKSSLLLLNLMGVLLQLTKMGYFILNGRYRSLEKIYCWIFFNFM